MYPTASITVKGLQEGEVKRLKNPDNVSKKAIESGLELYRKVMKCEDPAIKGALQQAVQVRAKSKITPWYEWSTANVLRIGW